MKMHPYEVLGQAKGEREPKCQIGTYDISLSHIYISLSLLSF